ncbi:uncharacterized protein [Salvelinus sp. IW2-2015]|uniref:uncharacterized protein n=1 Tax=Salvelinus sp. IW2-2015 TaxID=2691554 RepID=UPI0038D4CBDD
MDLFTDVDLLCDLMEASNKRKVPVYILLDEKNLNYFVDTCAALDILNSHLGHLSPERRGGSLTPTPQNQTTHGMRGSPNETNHSLVSEHPSSGIGHLVGIEWSKSSPTEFLQQNIGGTTSKFPALGLYDHKSSLFISSPKTQSPVLDNKLSAKQRTPSNPLLNKLTDLVLPPTKKDYLPPTEKDTYIFKRSPPHSTVFGVPDRSQTDPETKYIPLPSPPMINRQDQKGMTLGHSKLDQVNHYNKMKSKQVYSKFKLKNTNCGSAFTPRCHGC